MVFGMYVFVVLDSSRIGVVDGRDRRKCTKYVGKILPFLYLMIAVKRNAGARMLFPRIRLSLQKGSLG